MSYILEALKKAQAERQLGSTPGIHDTPSIAPSASAAPGRNRLWLALGAALLLAAGGVAIVRMATGSDAPQPATLAVLADTQPVAVPVPAAPAVARTVTPPPAQAALPVAAPAKPVEVPPAPKTPEVAQAPVAAAQPEPPALAVQAPQAEPDDALPTLAELPHAVRSGVPQVTLGGYIYSPVPSERLLLVDKNLRREGEEVGPGLMLERLLPRAAVMNYRGTRFRMPY